MPKKSQQQSSAFKRTLIAIIGGFILLIGIIAIPYPGPGWLIVFTGLGILATEFDWAQDVLEYGKKRYEAWQQWLKQQSTFTKSVFWFLTTIIVVATIYLLNGYGFLNTVLDLKQNWLQSPLPIFSVYKNSLI